MKKVNIEIDSKVQELEVRDSELLIETLRDRLGLMGTKYSCLEGDCGVCTVLIGGRNVLSCLILSADCDGEKITTIEGLAKNGEPHQLQKSFIEKGAIQCGFCTPGMILAAHSLLDKDPDPEDEEIARALDGNLCRCTGYVKIIDAVRDASQKINRSTKS
ncbi:MAG TPA: (2Fe-2S)-binding protein [Candidatus Omnitrophica bacterium]|nr:(2Fe-2S)-binding protein [Candidatus Omnitrophota bacterium]